MSQEDYHALLNEFKTLKSMKYRIAVDVLGKGHILSGEERGELVDKHIQKNDTPQKARDRVSKVLSILRKGGLYRDEYFTGEKVSPFTKKKVGKDPQELIPKTFPETLPNRVPPLPLLPSLKNSTSIAEGNAATSVEGVIEKLASLSREEREKIFPSVTLEK